MHNKEISEIVFPFKQNQRQSFIKIIAIIVFGGIIFTLGLNIIPYTNYIIITIGCIFVLKSKSIYNWLIS